MDTSFILFLNLPYLYLKKSTGKIASCNNFSLVVSLWVICFFELIQQFYTASSFTKERVSLLPDLRKSLPQRELSFCFVLLQGEVLVSFADFSNCPSTLQLGNIMLCCILFFFISLGFFLKKDFNSFILNKNGWLSAHILTLRNCQNLVILESF